LDLLLGTLPGVWTLGEAQRLLLEVEASNPCGCGKKYGVCKFWKSLVPKIRNKTRLFPIGHFRLPSGAGKVLRWSLFPQIFLGTVSGSLRKQIRAYGTSNVRYFSSVKRQAAKLSRKPVRWMVDASKDVYRLLWLLDSKMVDLRVVHIIKDPRSFVYSMANRDGSFPWLFSLRMTIRWIVENELATSLAARRLAREEVLVLLYEDLARHPNKTRDKLAQWLGINARSWSPRSFRQKANHAIAGNKMRWSRSPIKLDERWRDGLPVPHQIMIALITFPWRWKYGFR